MQTYNSAPRHEARYDKIDVLSLVDPQWLEQSQASRLLQMVAEAKCEALTEKHAPTPNGSLA
ncbi:MAG TPA: hypothetical protein VF624_09250 [Tepidisphaeraceae bacterium]|jgi:hypothetical protein